MDNFWNSVADNDDMDENVGNQYSDINIQPTASQTSTLLKQLEDLQPISLPSNGRIINVLHTSNTVGCPTFESCMYLHSQKLPHYFNEKQIATT